MKSPVAVVDIQEIPENTPHGIELEGLSLVIVQHEGQFQVFEGKCPHQGTLLSEGWVEAGHLVCRTHQWKFSCLTGEKVRDQKTCLQKFSCKEEGGKLWLDKDEVLKYKVPNRSEENATLKPPTELPGPKGIPVLGNLLQVKNTSIHQTVEEWSKEFGKLFKIYMGSRIFVISTDPTLNLHLLKIRPHSVSRSHRMQNIMKDFGIIGVFNAEGEQWRRQRQFVMQGLANKHLRQFFPIIVQVTQKLLNKWQNSAENEEVIDIQKDLMRYTVDVTTNLAFGYAMNTIEQEKDVIQEHLEVIFPAINRRLYSVFHYWKYFKLPQDKKLDRALSETRVFIDKILKESREKVANNPELQERPSNFLEALLVAKDEDGSKFTDDEIYSNVFTMLLAGEDTTANTISWMAYYLTEYPEIAQKIREEVDAVLGDTPVMDDLALGKSLPYIDAFALETMRFKPVAPINGVNLIEDVAYGGYLFPKGSNILIVSRPASKSEEHYQQADRFNPDRWLDPEMRKKDRYNIPFGSGPRLCPGRSLALLEIKVAVAMLVKNFDLERVPQKENVKEFLAFTMMPRNLYIRFVKRTTKSSKTTLSNVK